MSKVRLYNVIDTRTGQWYSEVVVKENKAHWFVPAEEGEEA